MAHCFHLHLLGPAQLDQDGEPLQGFKSNKTLALLGYVATERQPVSRSYLVELFWPNQSEARGRNNLSQALHNLSNLWPGWVKATRHTVQFCQTAAHWLDIQAFEEWETTGEMHALVMAADLYRGDFMAGLVLDDCPEFEQWLRIQQETWRQRMSRVLQNLVAHHTSRNNLEQALHFVSRLLAVDPGDEASHCHKMRLLAQSGQRSAALAQFEICRSFLADELGVEPAPETIELYEQIRAGLINGGMEQQASQSEKVTSAPPRNLPALSITFIDRETEVAVIKQYLANPTCRLLTIVGLGGIGKTCLALKVAPTVNFSDGICFIPLAFTHSAEFLISTIADTLRCPLYGRGQPKAQLLNYLSEKEMLLILDNFEHLMNGAGLLVEILQHAPQVKLLVTSRERLGLPEEWVLDLPGLPFPESEHSSKIEKYSAVQLFLQRAQQVRADFWLTFLDKPAVAQICRLVEGLPLGIELAAAWIRTLSAQEIAAEIEKSYHFLTTSLQNMPQRHRSLQAVFEHSWQLLSETEKKVFRRLSIFRRGFSRSAAERIAGASTLLLSALVDKSLLRCVAEDHYEMHELLRQYAATRLAEHPQEKGKTQYRQCRYYAALVQTQEARLKAGQQKEALETISAEIENVRAGWQWAISRRRKKESEQYLEGLFCYYQMQSRFQEGEALFGQAAASWRNGAITNTAETTGSILGQVLARQGLFCASLGDYEKARNIMDEALSLLEIPEIRRETSLGLNYLGAIALALGEYSEARRLCEESMMIARKIGDRWQEALALEYLGLVAISRSEYLEARALAQRSLVLFREFDYGSGIAGSLNILGIVARNLGEYAEAKQQCREALLIAREIGDQWEEALSLEYLSRIAISQGDYGEAKELAQQSLAIYRKFDYSSGMALALNLQGNAARHLAQYTEAKQLHQEVLQNCRLLNYPLGIAQASLSLGYLAHLLGDYLEAKRWLTESLALTEKLTYQHGVIRSLNALGGVACALDQVQEAKAYLHQALKAVQQIRAMPIGLEVFITLANLLIRQGQTSQAIELLAFALNHPASKKETRDKASGLLAQIAAKLPDPVVVAAQEKSQAGKFDAMVTALLHENMGEGVLLACY